MIVNVRFKLLSETALPPSRQHPTDAGFDIHADTDIVIPHLSYSKVGTGLAVEFPVGYEGHIRGRSGLASKGVLCHFGTIDQYRGEWFVMLFNLSGEDLHIQKGDRIAQMVVAELADVSLEEAHDLAPGDRGENGLGSTGR